jgi:hypothetical protein
VSSHINTARDYLALGEPGYAWEHLQQAEARYDQDVWFRWIYYPRLQAEMASYLDRTGGSRPGVLLRSNVARARAADT